MGELIDKAKGNANEAVGELKQESDNPETRREGEKQELKGKGQQFEGEAKGAMGNDI